eukprot:CAMPEP_0173436432 /NCGR_PEP_ID=MMETSP1357-20121228/16120_1 /TAXON_ID=77926 /ORGANISM="Hemiselmis rufescens, Strain PCC563" /LENGTH=63 /DNA_ID=CAMNT_0014401509 /DNA_START=48 /DNA_END=239 /DNA_ORIENTATION=-
MKACDAPEAPARMQQMANVHIGVDNASFTGAGDEHKMLASTRTNSLRMVPKYLLAATRPNSAY